MKFEITEEQSFIKDISRDLVTQLAPEELDLFDELAQEYFENPKPPESLSTSIKDNPLGFGLGETIVATTPAITAVVSTIIQFLATEFVKTARDETSEMIKKKVKILFDSAGAKKGEVSPLSDDQLEHVKKLARKQAIQFGMNAKQAENMANALAGRLALSK